MVQKVLSASWSGPGSHRCLWLRRLLAQRRNTLLVFCVVSKRYGCAKSQEDEWTFEPEKVSTFTKETATAFCGEYDRVELSSITIDNLQRLKEMAPRARGRPAKVNTQASELMAALEFVSVAVADHEFYKEHVRLENNFVVAFNGQMAAGHPITEDLKCCPHADKLKSAIAKCGKSLAIVQTPGGKLSVKGDKLNALVPCLPAYDVPVWTPNKPMHPLADVEAIKEGFKICGALASEAASDVIQAALLLEGNQVTSTNRQIIIQYWHGVDLPPNIVIPKIFAMAVAKQTKPIVGFGFQWYDANTCDKVSHLTFYFDGGAWISTVCYADLWPDMSRVLNVQSFPVDVPAGLFDGIGAVYDFNDKGYVTFADGKVQSHASNLEGAQYDVAGLQAGKQFGAKAILKIAPFVKAIDYTTFPQKAMFFGGEPGHGIRGAIAAIVESSEGPPVQQIKPQEEINANDASDTGDTGEENRDEESGASW